MYFAILGNIATIIENSRLNMIKSFTVVMGSNFSKLMSHTLQKSLLDFKDVDRRNFECTSARSIQRVKFKINPHSTLHTGLFIGYMTRATYDKLYILVIYND